MLDLKTLLKVPFVDTEMGFDLSPNGERIAFSSNLDGQWEIYEAQFSDGSGIRRISSGAGSKFAPRYSPDGKALVYAVDFTGAENYHIFLHDLSLDQSKDLTPRAEGAIQPYFAWSPDGTRLAFPYDRSGRFNVFILPVDQGLEHAWQIFDAGFPAWKVAWSPDGGSLAVVVEASGIDYGTYIVPLKNHGNPTRISDEDGPIDAGQVAWSPDGKYLAFSSDTHGYNNIGIYEPCTGRIKWLTDGEGEKQYPAWSPDGQTLAYVLNRGTVSWLAIHEFEKPAILRRIAEGAHYWPRFSPDGKQILFAFDNPCQPPDLWKMSMGGESHQITHSMPDGLNPAAFIQPQEITYPGLDGILVPALLFNPGARVPGAAVVLVHGGPDWHFEMTWYPVMAAMASRGWVVLVPNYRGSTGYGRAWQNASRFDYGGVDAEDVIAGAQYLVQAQLAAPDRIGITGRSHGGYLTACCMTRVPELWAAGSAFVPFLNWFTNHEEIRPDLQHWDIENFGDPVENHDRWRERSPSFHLDRINAPIQLICGRQDARCPVSDSIEASATLQELGKEVELILYENEGHIFQRMENIIDSETRRLEFLIKYLESRDDNPIPGQPLKAKPGR